MDQYLIYAGVGLGAISFLMIIVDHLRLNSAVKKYRQLIKGLSERNVEDLMISYAKGLEDIKQDLSDNIQKRLEVLEHKLPSCLRKVGMVTYNAFNNVGNNMSFSIAALDDNDDGYILTGIYTRENSYIYAKQIRKGQPADKELSKEEKDALGRALAKG